MPKATVPTKTTQSMHYTLDRKISLPKNITWQKLNKKSLTFSSNMATSKSLSKESWTNVISQIKPKTTSINLFPGYCHTFPKPKKKFRQKSMSSTNHWKPQQSKSQTKLIRHITWLITRTKSQEKSRPPLCTNSNVSNAQHTTSRRLADTSTNE